MRTSNNPICNRWLRTALVIGALAVSGCGDDTPTEVVNPPETDPVTVTGYSATTVLPGDTIEVTGTGFSEYASSNRVVFSNRLAVAFPYWASATAMMVEVPDDAASGPVTVTVSGKEGAGTGPRLEVVRGVGDVWVYGGLGSNEPLNLTFPVPSAEYLLIPHVADPTIPYAQENSYTISNQAVSPLLAPPTGVTGAPPFTTVQERFDRHLRDEFDRIVAAAGPSVPTRRKPQRSSAQQPPLFRQFYVLNTVVGSTILPSSYTQITAMLRYAGQNCWIYSDVDTLATGNLTQADYDAFGQNFDNPSGGIHDVNTTYFGTESDVDGNGRVIVLISPVINELPETDPQWAGDYYIGGFFLSIDLFRAGQMGVPAGTTNEAEIFYVLAADPNGAYLDGSHFNRAYVSTVNLQTIAHEYQHLISYSYRLFNHGTAYIQALWLEEGMSHMAEDLNGMNASNIGRANLYLGDPGGMSLEHGTAPLAQRGGIYLFLRYLGDRFGNGIYEDVLQSSCVGRPCVETITGESFYATVSDFLATLYLSGSGITSDPKYNYTSIDLDDFEPVLTANHTTGAAAISGTVRRATGDFHLFTKGSTSAGNFVFNPASLSGLRTTVVRRK